jgi:hypothetical protein
MPWLTGTGCGSSARNHEQTESPEVATVSSRFGTYAVRIALTLGVFILLDSTAFSGSERREVTTTVVPERAGPGI